MSRLFHLRLVTLALAFVVPLTARAEIATVFAAASLKDALDAIGADSQANGHEAPVISYRGTPALARQIIGGAPLDVFIPAGPDWMDSREGAGLVVAGSRRDLPGNTLVLIVSGTDAAPVMLDTNLDLARLDGSGRLAMATVDSVPAGIYGREALISPCLWDRVEPLVAQTENVRAALAPVATGETPLGIVYGSDAVAARAAGEGISVIATIPPANHSPITYPVALIRDTAGARVFVDYLSRPAARAVFEAQGFTMLP